MATTRKRSSGFSTGAEENDTNLDEIAEIVEEQAAEKMEEPLPVVTPPSKPFVEETIVPSEDVGPRFVKEVEPPPAIEKVAPKLSVAPKRHPRNIPKFSRHKAL
jgi:hypothetical protein